MYILAEVICIVVLRHTGLKFKAGTIQFGFAESVSHSRVLMLDNK